MFFLASFFLNSIDHVSRQTVFAASGISARLFRKIKRHTIRGDMNNESRPRSEKTDDQTFEDIRTLTEKEGWQFRGNIFRGGKLQTYQLILSKEGGKDKTLYTKKPYPKAADITGKVKHIP